jgi:hypothetical protein
MAQSCSWRGEQHKSNGAVATRIQSRKNFWLQTEHLASEGPLLSTLTVKTDLKVPFKTGFYQELAAEIAQDELNHVRFFAS